MDVHHSDASFLSDDVVALASNDLIKNGDSEMEGEEPIHAQSDDDLIRVTHMLRENATSFQRAPRQENVNHILTKQEMEDAEAKAGEPGAITCMEAPNLEFKNMSTWVDIMIANPWAPYKMVSQPVEDVSTYKGHIFVQKGWSFTSLKHFYKIALMLSCLQVHRTLPKLKCKQKETDCAWSLRVAKWKVDESSEIKKYKGAHTCVNPLMNMDR